MAAVELIYNGVITTLQCNESDKIKNILNKFLMNLGKNMYDLFFLYGGQVIQENKTFNEIANSEDKKRKKISILVFDNKTSSIYQNTNLKKSKFIICPKCHDNIRINIKNFKIKLFNCHNKHIIDNLSITEFNNSQLIDESKIICDICKKVNKAKTFNNLFFICSTCNKNICPLCNSSHDKKHNIMEYDQKYFKCKLHNESYYLYCNDCNKNICIICEIEHNNHNNEIIIKLNNIIQNVESYYNIYNDLITGYEIHKRNYQMLQNIKDMDRYNKDFIYELNNIIQENNIYSKLEKLLNLYNKMNLNKTELNNIISYEERIKNLEAKIKEIQSQNNQITYQIKDYENGRYEGEFKNGKREGKGIYYYKDGDRYEGEFKNDKYEGKGIYYYDDGDRYEGEFKNSLFEGKGIYYYTNDPWKGDTYEGDWKNDKKEGKGIYYWNDGDRYEGDWKNDSKEGKGIYYYNNGNREMGDYLNGKKIGKHVTLMNNGEIKINIYN